MKSKLFDYQSVCHCSKTLDVCADKNLGFDYQSVCHCSKTAPGCSSGASSLTTSQFVTAPKPPSFSVPPLIV